MQRRSSDVISPRSRGKEKSTHSWKMGLKASTFKEDLRKHDFPLMPAPWGAVRPHLYSCVIPSIESRHFHFQEVSFYSYVSGCRDLKE